MVKADLKLKNGTVVTIEGTPDEVKRLLLSMSEGASAEPRHVTAEKKSTGRNPTSVPQRDTPSIDHAAIANLTRSCEEAELLEARVLDKTALENKVLLPLFIAHKHVGEHVTLTSGDVNKITKQLGIPVDQAAASRCLGGSSLVMGDSVRKKGRPVGYKLNRRGVKHFESLLSAEEPTVEPPAVRRPSPRGKREKVKASAMSKDSSTPAAVQRRAPSARTSGTPANGRPGPAVLVDQLIRDGFFKSNRTISQILDHAKAVLARSYERTDLSPALTRALRAKKLQRARNNEGQYEYRQA